MNNVRRKRLIELRDKLEDLKFELDELKDEENEAMENLPDNMQSGERYEAMEEAVYGNESAMDSVDEAVISLNDII